MYKNILNTLGIHRSTSRILLLAAVIVVVCFILQLIFKMYHIRCCRTHKPTPWPNALRAAPRAFRLVTIANSSHVHLPTGEACTSSSHACYANTLCSCCSDNHRARRLLPRDQPRSPLPVWSLRSDARRSPDAVTDLTRLPMLVFRALRVNCSYPDSPVKQNKAFQVSRAGWPLSANILSAG